MEGLDLLLVRGPLVTDQDPCNEDGEESGAVRERGDTEQDQRAREGTERG
jgi:hypothetical protein